MTALPKPRTVVGLSRTACARMGIRRGSCGWGSFRGAEEERDGS